MIKKEMHQYAKQFGLYHTQWKITALQTVNLILNMVLALSFATILSKLIQTKPVAIDWSVAFIFLLIISIKAFTQYQSTVLTDKMSETVKTELRHNITVKLLSLSPKQLATVERVKMTQLVCEGIEQIDVYYTRYLPQFFYSLLAPILLFLFFAQFHLGTALIFLAMVFLIPVTIVLGVKIGKRVFFTYWEKYLNVGKRFAEGVQGIETLQSAQQDAHYQTLLQTESETFRIMTMRVLRMQLQSITLMDLVTYVGTALGLVVSLVAFQNGTISLVGLVCILLLGAEFFVPMRLLGSYFHVGMNGTSAVERMDALLNIQQENERGSDMNVQLPIQSEGVTVELGGQKILHDVSFLIRKGEWIAFAGRSGAGKTTIAEMLQQFVHVKSGTVQFGNVPIEKLAPDSVRSFIGSVSSDTHLFHGTLLENLRLADEQLTEQEARDVLNAVRFHDADARMHRTIQSEGKNVSSGERQKIALARLLIRNPEVIIFDEAFVNVDRSSEAELLDVLGELQRKGKTIVMITHRLAHLKHADRIYVVESGRIAQIGAYDELLEAKGVFQSLAQGDNVWD
ncbi:MAG: ABC transporter ATP-binding protein/permease [Bacilli bacterium]